MELDIHMSRVQAVIFDLDGVICNTEPIHVRSWQVLFASRGIEVPEEEILEGVGIADRVLLEDILVRRGVQADVSDWLIAKRKIYLDMLQESTPAFPGAVELIRQLNWNWPLAIASSAWRIAIETITRRLDIRRHFRAIIAKEDVEHHKPSPEPFLAAARQLGVKASDCAVIEDSVAGVEAAGRAGMLCIAVTNSFPAERLGPADLIVDSLEATDQIFSLLAAPSK